MDSYFNKVTEITFYPHIMTTVISTQVTHLIARLSKTINTGLSEVNNL